MTTETIVQHPVIVVLLAVWPVWQGEAAGMARLLLCLCVNTPIRVNVIINSVAHTGLAKIICVKAALVCNTKI